MCSIITYASVRYTSLPAAASQPAHTLPWLLSSLCFPSNALSALQAIDLNLRGITSMQTERVPSKCNRSGDEWPQQAKNMAQPWVGNRSSMCGFMFVWPPCCMHTCTRRRCLHTASITSVLSQRFSNADTQKPPLAAALCTPRYCCCTKLRHATRHHSSTIPM